MGLRRLASSIRRVIKTSWRTSLRRHDLSLHAFLTFILSNGGRKCGRRWNWSSE